VVRTRHVADARRRAQTRRPAADLRRRPPPLVPSSVSRERSGATGQLSNGRVDRSVLPVNRWARHVRVNGTQRPSSLLDTSALQVGPSGQIQCQSAGIDKLVHIAKNLLYTCDILRFKRKPAVFRNLSANVVVLR
jgi:hypothetical protein